MHLKTLTLRGFKSFASATTLKFEPGITCVVGPNGSGKSNVVDALAWVMGEQGAKALRGGNMADVVFAGTSSRPALGRAEVSLTIDNTDGALPIDYSEVTISRTLFRSGGSEYAINGTACRLLDIQELLSDTGMGRQMHVIVGQGQLDAVLHATPEERRGFIEEAAGVLKHRRRKDKALRKLETMAGNLNRLEDLTAEIRRQLGPLARQADVARRAQVIQAELRDAKSRLYADDYAQLGAQLAAESVGERELAEERAAAQAEVTRLRTWLADMEASAADVAPRVRTAADTVVALSTLRERLGSIHTLARERARFLDAPPPTHGGPDPDELDRQAASARAAETELHGEQATAEQALAVASTGRVAAEAAEREAEHRLAAVHRGVADRREGLARLAGQVAARESRIEAARAEQGRLTESLEAAKQRAAQAETQYTALEREIAAQGESGGDLEQAHAAALAAAEAADKHAKELADAERAERSAAQVARAQLETLALSLGRKDGTAQLAADGFADALIEQAITVAEPWRAAIAAALGEFADAALASDRDATLAALAHARQAGAGRVRVVHGSGAAGTPGGADAATDADTAQELTAAVSADGVQAALDVVEVKDAAHRGAIVALLADTVLVAELADAAAVAAAHPQLRVVTAAGDVLHGARATGGGEVTGSPIELQGRHDEAAAALAAADEAATRLKSEREQADAAAEAARREVAATLSAVRSADAQAAQANQKLAQLAATLRSAQAEVERSGPAIARLDEELQAHDAELAELRERLVVAEKEPQDAEADLAAAQTARDGAAQSATDARRAETDARLQLRTVQERIAALAGRAKQLEEAAEAERTTRRRAEERYRRREAAAHVADQVRADADAALQAIAISLNRAQAERADAEAAQAEYHRELAGVRASIDAATTRLTELTDAAHREELARAELTMRLESLAERIREELAVDADTLVEEFGPHLPIVELATDKDGEEVRVEKPYVREQQEKRFKRAERDVARLGKINPLALEEHAALNERHEFLTSQVADIKKSRADLLRIVAEIDERVERVFTEAYADTAREFEGVFDRLFPGGEGRLVLTDPDDMLTTGIEVEARPAGKKVKRLSLLSGGERSLTAIALLVAIFKARPSPFYVMDEVEAALDDRNLDRLLSIFTELQHDSQLIVITHQKRTMEVADALYGVSMRDGVSAVISQRL
ncbi:chromosome segregation protein SMC [Bowdeniella nasicola]|uniref:Chromosome partition protein Smc n=1 Tax=Bowdeniella nasicola TaxID=208480 RepID=A0A1Q5Q162_9ACTO|nr:chromosome segregation protein SMC [Bowdeniella nasicola]OKL53537.1 chromosome segregation protein SMC [Bowdeniella nasicola]